MPETADAARRLPDRDACRRMDAEHKLAALRQRFHLPRDTIYLCGNSMGPVAAGVPEAMRKAVEQDWTQSVVRGWSTAGWHVAPTRVGAQIARLIGAAEDEVIVADSTTVNQFKLLVGAMRMQPGRGTIIAERGDFPTDMYIAAGTAELLGAELRLVPPDDLMAAIDSSLGVILVSQVNYRAGRRHDMQAMTRAVHEAGGLIIWDLCHSAGVMDIALDACEADFAVGCGYKYLNGGPGAPSYAFVAKRHQANLRQPLTGWHGHARPFAFTDDYAPAEDISRMRCGTSPQLSLVALEAALTAFDGVDMKALRQRSEQLTDLFIALYDAHLARRGFSLATPRERDQRGSQISLRHPDGASIMQALIARGVIGDFRAPDVLRFGLAPMFTSCVEVYDTAIILADIVDREEHKRPEHFKRADEL